MFRFKFSLLDNLGKQFHYSTSFPHGSKSLFANVLKQYPLKKSELNISLSCAISNIHDTISSINLKKRIVRKKRTIEDEISIPGTYNVVAFATAEEYNLENLIKGLQHQDLYEPKNFENCNDIVHAIAKYQVEKEPREIFFFREGM